MVLGGYESAVGTQVEQPAKIETPSINIAGQQAISLSQKLSSFASTLTQGAQQNARIKAAENATKDMGVYKEKMNEIIISDKSKADKDKALQALQEKHEYDGWGMAYKNAYKTQFDAAYANTITNEAAGVSDLITSQANGSSSSYMNSWGQYTESIMKSAPNDSLAAVAKLTLDKQGSARYKALATAEYTKRYAVDKKSSEDVLSYLEEEYKSAYAAQDTARMNATTKQFTEALDSARRSGFITKNQQDVRLAIATDDAIIGRIDSDIKHIIDNNGNVTKAISQTYDSPMFKKLPLKKQQDLMKSLLSQVKEKNTRIKEAITAKEKQEKLHQGETYKETLYEVYSGNATIIDINKMEVNGDLNKADADSLRGTLSEGSRKFSDTQTIAWYSLKSNLADTSESDIYNDGNLSWKDKKTLIDDRRALLTSKEYKWTTTQNGIEGRKRIKRLFGFHEGTMMAGLDMNNQTQKDYNSMMDNYFDHVSSLPIEEQAAAAKQYADKLITAYSGDKDSEAKAKQQEMRERNQKKADEAYKKYNTSFTLPWTTLKSKEDYTSEWLKSKKLEGTN